MSITIGRINLYFPLNYQIRSDLFLIQLKNLKSFKREHDSVIASSKTRESSKNVSASERISSEESPA